MNSTIQSCANFAEIRYGQCWEDADVLLDGLAIKPGSTCLSIASAGDNTLALLTRRPQRVIAVDFSAAQLACLELRVAAYRELEYREMLELIGSRASRRRFDLYCRCRALLTPAARHFWDSRAAAIAAGIGSSGKFENYFRLFRERVLPFAHSRARVQRLLAGGEPVERERFYNNDWDTWRWRALFKVFFSRWTMSRFGRDPRFFRYVEGDVAMRILGRTRRALTELNPADNPYLHWILTDTHGCALPLALRPEHFATIRDNLDCLEWRQCSIEQILAEIEAGTIDGFNLSDIFEYMSNENYHALLLRLADAGRPGARLVYWNMLVPRRRPERMADRLTAHTELAAKLLARDKAFFYSALVVEEVAA